MKTHQSYQFDLFEKVTAIETVVITPTKDMPIEVFRECWHLAYFMELMDRLPDGRVLWDEDRSDIINPDLADAEYYAMQNDWFTMQMELPKKFVEQFEEIE